jgi:catechol 2,3-dioxygenase-like lactoylglutathione lyase family enzyme
MALSHYHLNASIAVSDIQQAVAFYEGKLGLPVLQRGPSAHIADGSRVYGFGDGPALNVYQSETAGKSPATLPTWYVDNIEQIVDELTAAGVEFSRYDLKISRSRSRRRSSSISAWGSSGTAFDRGPLPAGSNDNGNGGVGAQVGELAGAPRRRVRRRGHRSPGEERHRRSRPWRVESGRRGG